MPSDTSHSSAPLEDPQPGLPIHHMRSPLALQLESNRGASGSMCRKAPNSARILESASHPLRSGCGAGRRPGRRRRQAGPSRASASLGHLVGSTGPRLSQSVLSAALRTTSGAVAEETKRLPVHPVPGLPLIGEHLDFVGHCRAKHDTNIIDVRVRCQRINKEDDRVH